MGLWPVFRPANLSAMRNVFFGLLALTLAIVSGFGEQVDFHFATQPAGPLPEGFVSTLAGRGHPGHWAMIPDDGSPSTNHPSVLAQTAADPLDEHFPLCVYNAAAFRDFKFTTRFKTVGGLLEQMAGIIFRYQNPSNFYVLRYSALGHNLSFYPMVNGVRVSDPIPLMTGLDFAPGSWHSLGVRCDGIDFTCWLDNQPVGPVIHDPTFAVGKVGFWTKSDAVSWFTDATVEYTPRVPTAQKIVDRLMELQPRILSLRIYATNANGEVQAIASNLPGEQGLPGEASEKSVLAEGSVFYGHNQDRDDIIVLPLHDRNGEPIAAVRIELKSYFGESQNAALTRGNMIVKKMEEQTTSRDELMQ